MTYSNLYIRRKSIIYMLLLFPFFELYSLEMLIGKGIFPEIIKVVTYVYVLFRMIIAAYAICAHFYEKKKINNVTIWGIMLFVFMLVLSSWMNGSVYLTYITGAFTYIGFAFLLNKLIKDSYQDVIVGGMILFGIYSVLNFVTTLLFPNGFFNARDKAEAVYFLGSKNSSYYYYLILLLLVSIHTLYKKEKIRNWHMIYVILLMISAFVCRSSNTLMCLFIIFAYYFIAVYGKILLKFLDWKILCIAIVFISLLIMFGANSEFVYRVVTSLGRDMSFSGRDYLWEQALEQFVDEPLWGNGVFSTFVLKTGVIATHAHNLFLDLLAKHGGITLLSFFMLIGSVFLSIGKEKDKSMRYMKGVFLFVILLHNVFDDCSVFFTIFYFVILSYIDKRENI